MSIPLTAQLPLTALPLVIATSPPSDFTRRWLVVKAAPIAFALLLGLVGVASANEPSATAAAESSPNAAILVTNCSDDGAGSLRGAVASAASGDTVVLKPSGCDHIRLTGGPILISQDDLTLIGPGSNALLVSGDRRSQVLRHSGSGTLQITALSIGYGRRGGENALGGCIQTSGNLQLKMAHIHHCVAHGSAEAPFPSAIGGGIYALGDVSLTDTVVRENLADSAGEARAGGLYAGGRLTMRRSRVLNNATSGGDGGGPGGVLVYGAFHADYSDISGNRAGFIGGIAAYGGVVILHSAILNNRAGVRAGGAVLGGFGDVLIVDSTISGNAAITLGGLDVGHRATLANSTVAFNRELTTDPAACEGGLHYYQLHLESTIVARNFCNGRPVDITATSHDVRPVVGADNLVEFSTGPLPTDTLSTDPHLLPLADNGGPTRTLALRPDSPAIDLGNNVLGLHFDQRGRNFLRVNGQRADIGAYELESR